MHPTLALVLVVLGGYLFGSVSFAVLISRLLGLADPRSYGSGNPGATNVLRSGSKVAALLTLLGDAGKGALAAWLVLRFGPAWGLDEDAAALTGLAAFVGHLYPLYHRFKGGKGVATFLGVVWVLSPWLGLRHLHRVVAGRRLLPLLLGCLDCQRGGGAVRPSVLRGIDVTFLALAAMAVLLVMRHRAEHRQAACRDGAEDRPEVAAVVSQRPALAYKSGAVLARPRASSAASGVVR